MHNSRLSRVGTWRVRVGRYWSLVRESRIILTKDPRDGNSGRPIAFKSYFSSSLVSSSLELYGIVLRALIEDDVAPQSEWFLGLASAAPQTGSLIIVSGDANASTQRNRHVRPRLDGMGNWGNSRNSRNNGIVGETDTVWREDNYLFN
jgi:hypothetical protein